MRTPHRASRALLLYSWRRQLIYLAACEICNYCPCGKAITCNYCPCNMTNVSPSWGKDVIVCAHVCAFNSIKCDVCSKTRPWWHAVPGTLPGNGEKFVILLLLPRDIIVTPFGTTGAGSYDFQVTLALEWSNIGITHDFLCINICWAPREMLKPKPQRRGFQHLPRVPACVNVSENHVWPLLLH